jgi:hypothetical protein
LPFWQAYISGVLAFLDQLRVIAEEAGDMADIAAEHLDKSEKRRDFLYCLVNELPGLSISGDRHLAAYRSDLGFRAMVPDMDRHRPVEFHMVAIAGLRALYCEIEHELGIAARW